ncbi:uncharacterized protein LOC125468214 [Pyrus x bretschneideri]|uniref:uncharacterized protein LOC125468214 n=1 Tax=Pyrus x bretschneideri TaxID=225117 RepID=UPI00202F685B|nr:uncharacterized protein LOC125468214 [Pyrus x bretschneideri]
MVDDGTESENVLSDLDTAMWKFNSEEKHDSTASRAANYDFRSSSDEEEDLTYTKGGKEWVNDSESNLVIPTKLVASLRHQELQRGKLIGGLAGATVSISKEMLMLAQEESRLRRMSSPRISPVILKTKYGN